MKSYIYVYTIYKKLVSFWPLLAFSKNNTEVQGRKTFSINGAESLGQSKEKEKVYCTPATVGGGY